ncbi:hypothetical protein DFAR_3180014 [Desulfarculales bacterium]
MASRGCQRRPAFFLAPDLSVSLRVRPRPIAGMAGRLAAPGPNFLPSNDFTHNSHVRPGWEELSSRLDKNSSPRAPAESAALLQ